MALAWRVELSEVKLKLLYLINEGTRLFKKICREYTVYEIMNV